MMCLRTEEWKQQRARRLNVGYQLLLDMKYERRHVKILLLGTSECGKSTLFKQLRCIHGAGYNDHDRMGQLLAVYRNLFAAVQTVIGAMDALGLRYGDARSASAARPIVDADFGTVTVFDTALMDAVRLLCRDPGVMECHRRGDEYELSDSASYYFSAADRLTGPKYLPTDRDILHVQAATVGVAEHSFYLRHVRYLIVDVGGQESERLNWTDCFHDVASFVYLVSLTDYDRNTTVVVADGSASENRIRESLAVFRDIVTCVTLRHVCPILLMNKNDLFEEKIMRSHLRDTFPEYGGPERHATPARQYIKDLFMDANVNKRTIYSHYTCATDVESVRTIFTAVKDSIVRKYFETWDLI